MLRKYLKTLLAIVMVFANFMSFYYCFVAMTYASDWTFLLGMVGVVTTIFVDLAIIKNFYRRKLNESK